MKFSCNWNLNKFFKSIIVFIWTIIWNRGLNFLLGAIDISCESIGVRSRLRSKMNAAAGMKAASISASPRRVNQLPVSFSFVTPCVSPFSLNHSSKRFDSCRLRRGTSYSSHLPIDFSLFNSMNSILPINCLESRRKLYDSLNISVIFRVSISISRDKKEGNQSLFNDEEWIAGIDRVSNGAELVKYASSRGIDFSVTLQSV